MANRYANLVGSNKIKDEWTKINAGFDAVQADMDAKADADDLVSLENTVNDHIGAGGNAHAVATDQQAGFMSAQDKQKLDGVEAGAQVNQNAFAKVNDLEADDPSDEVTISGGTGITVTTNPNTKEVIVTATGSSTPGPHGSSHTEHGADPIPNATTTEGGLMSAEYVQMLESHSSRHEIGGDDEINLEDLQGSPAALKSHLAETVTGVYNVETGYGGDIQAAVNAANAAGGGIVFLPPGDFPIYSQLLLYSNIILRGSGRGKTTITLPTAAAFDYIFAENAQNIKIEDLTIVGGGLAASLNYFGILFKTCQNCTVRDVNIHDAEVIGVKFLDCDYCTAENVYVSYPNERYAAETAGYAIELDGCGHCSLIACTGFQVHFGFVVIGPDGLGPAGNQSQSERSLSYAVNNTLTACHIDYHTGHAFDINCSSGNQIIGCTSDHYTGSLAARSAFQVKHSTNEDSEVNVISACSAMNCGIGFGTQRGSKVIFTGCTVKNALYDGFFLNATPKSQVVNCIVSGFGRNGVYFAASSHYGIIDNLYCEASNPDTTTAIRLEGVQDITVGNVQLRNTHAEGININAACQNTKIGAGARFKNSTKYIVDASPSTIYPLQMQVEVPLTAAGSFTIPTPQRGMWVARIRYLTTVAITGSPTVQCGRNGSNAELCAATAPNASVAGVVTPTLLSNSIPPTQFLQGSVAVAATAGRIIVSVEGLDLL